VAACSPDFLRSCAENNQLQNIFKRDLREFFHSFFVSVGLFASRPCRKTSSVSTDSVIYTSSRSVVTAGFRFSARRGTGTCSSKFSARSEKNMVSSWSAMLSCPSMSICSFLNPHEVLLRPSSRCSNSASHINWAANRFLFVLCRNFGSGDFTVSMSGATKRRLRSTRICTRTHSSEDSSTIRRIGRGVATLSTRDGERFSSKLTPWVEITRDYG